MKFSCQNCGAVFNIADQKISRVRELKFPCPKCGSAIELDNGALIQNAAAALHDFEPERPFEPEDIEDEGLPFEVVEEGVKTALLCVPQSSLLEPLTDVLRQMDYHVTNVRNSQSVLDRLRHTIYDLVLMEYPQHDSVIEHINRLSMPVRRRFFLCLVSDSASTLDRILAFRVGADLILNARDLNKASTILSQRIKEHGASYRIFWTELEKKGQL